MAESGDGVRDIIVVGASAGGVEALKQFVENLPPNLAAAVLVVLHRPPDFESLLPRILSNAGLMPAEDAIDGEPLCYGRIAIAPPDRHLQIEDGRLRLVRGPKENHSRPAIDPLFRSAAQEFGPRVAGVILSGTLFDGTAGLFVVKRRGGLTFVQDPQEAPFPGMPQSAIGNVPVDHVLPVAEIAALLARQAGTFDPSQPAGDVVPLQRLPRPEKEARTAMSSETTEFEQMPRIVAEDQKEQVRGDRHGQPTLYTCPDCGGTLWQANDGPLLQFRCHVGHIYTAEGMAVEQAETLERSLWKCIRLLEDKALLRRQLAERARERGEGDSARLLLAQAQEADAHGQALRQMVQAGSRVG